MRLYVISLCTLLAGCVLPVSTTGQAAVPVPIFIGIPDQTAAGATYVCTLKPFTREYRSEHSNKGRAKLNVQKQCQARHSAIFCEEKDIICQTYE